MSQYSFEFQGRTVHESQYGSDYVSSLTQILANHLKTGPRSILEWGSGLTTLVFSELGRYQPIRALFDILEDGSQFRAMRLRPRVAESLADGYERVIGAIPPGSVP